MDVINSPGMWLASSAMIMVALVQSILFLRAALAEAKRISIPREKLVSGFRSAVVTSLGPSLAPAIVSLALISLVGAPTTWMRLNDVGSAQTELAMLSLISKAMGFDPHMATKDIEVFALCLWGMALNNVGWMVVTLALTSRMGSMVKTLHEQYNPGWIKCLMGASALGIFSYLTSAQVVNAKNENWYAVIISAITMLFISKKLTKYRMIQELSLGLSMLAGMFGAVILTKAL